MLALRAIRPRQELLRHPPCPLAGRAEPAHPQDPRRRAPGLRPHQRRPRDRHGARCLRSRPGEITAHRPPPPARALQRGQRTDHPAHQAPRPGGRPPLLYLRARRQDGELRRSTLGLDAREPFADRRRRPHRRQLRLPRQPRRAALASPGHGDAHQRRGKTLRPQAADHPRAGALRLDDGGRLRLLRGSTSKGRSSPASWPTSSSSRPTRRGWIRWRSRTSPST